MIRFMVALFGIATGAVLFSPTSILGDVPNTTELVSTSTSGTVGDGHSPAYHAEYPAISGDGGFVAFSSDATDLVANDTNGLADVFVRDRALGMTERVSVDSNGNQANQVSHDPAISRDGRFVAFGSVASNLVANDTNGNYDVFVHDRLLGTTERVSVDGSGNQALFGTSDTPAISADGRLVAYVSQAANLVPGDTNGYSDVFVRDRNLGTTERVSLDNGGSQALNGYSAWPAISADGRFVAFESIAWNLVPSDENEANDVFVRDRLLGSTERISVDNSGAEADSGNGAASISDNGRYVAFFANSTNLVPGDTNDHADVFVRDRANGTTERVSVDSSGGQGGGDSCCETTISGDGRFVGFPSSSDSLVPDDSNGKIDIFVRDRLMNATSRISVGSGASQADGDSRPAAISADGHFTAFASDATNLVAADTNNASDVFVNYFADRDQDGIEDTGDNCPNTPNADQANQDGDEYGDACEQPQCVTVVNHWSVPNGDSDCDGFPDSVAASGKAPETYIGTDAGKPCAATVSQNDEAAPDANPMDFNDDRIFNGQDTGKFGGPFGSYNKLVGDGPFGPPGNELPGERFDFNGNGIINGQDTGKYQAYFNKTCAPQ